MSDQAATSRYFPHLTDGKPDEVGGKEPVIKISGKDYLKVHPRIMWFHQSYAPLMAERQSLIDQQLFESGEDQHKLLEAGVSPELVEAIFKGNAHIFRQLATANGYKIETEQIEHHWVPGDKNATFASFRAKITDPLGNIVTGHGMETYAGFPAGYYEKAETIAIGRALLHMGFGTLWMDGVFFEEGSEKLADTPVDRTSKPVSQTTAKPAGAVRQQPLQQPTPPTPQSSQTTKTALTPRSRERLATAEKMLPGILAWLKANKFDLANDEGDLRDLISEQDAVRIFNNQQDWVAEFKAAQKPVSAEVSTPQVAIVVEPEKGDPDPEDNNIDEETEAFLDEPTTSASLVPEGYSVEPQFPHDPESPTKGQVKYLGELVTECGGMSSNSVKLLMTELAKQYPCNKPEHVRKQRTPNGDGVLPEGKKPGIATCWTAGQFDEGIRQFKQLKADQEAQAQAIPA